MTVIPLCSLDEETLGRVLQRIGFSCLRCGDCCRPESPDSNLVMVSPGEVRRLVDWTRLSSEMLAEPYPGEVDAGRGVTMTFGRVLRRPGGNCLFYGEKGQCRAYGARPWICRTYPFMLGEDSLLVFPCRGLGTPCGIGKARSIARDLLERREAEREEEEAIRDVITRTPLPRGGRLLVDSEGVQVL